MHRTAPPPQRMIRRTCPNTINSAKAEKASSQTTWLHHQLYLEQLTYLLAACFLSFKMGIVLHSLGDHSRLRIQPCCCCGMGDVPGPGTSACCGHHRPPPQEKKNCRNLKKKPQSPTREDEPRQPAPRRRHPPGQGGGVLLLASTALSVRTSSCLDVQAGWPH